MTKRTTITTIAALLLLVTIALLAYERWHRNGISDRAAMLVAMPSTASTVFFADLAELRQSPFLAQLYAWAPKPQIDQEYAQFLRDTGFDYERDLDRIAIASINTAPQSGFFAIADGRFDRKKIVVYASQAGTHEKQVGHEVYSVPISAPPASSSPNGNSTAANDASVRKISITFLSNNRIAFATTANLGALLANSAVSQDILEWRERFDRLAGSPVFAVLRQDAAPGTALTTRAPGGFQSPQLASLLNHLQWITIAGKPEGDHLRIVTEGESADDASARQLSDMLNGILLMAQAGLNGPRIRTQLDPRSREAYLEILKTADVSRIDRRETKSIRLVFDVSPSFLAAAAHSALPLAAPVSPQPPNPAPKK
ncbi:MAG TPA: hypothetical protein VN780_09620 [Candidatus Eisenbacteria bacterium]|jgi:hypothetical protein|nr:hypothetical protein [Candidatus Eisenbacteria bacterium]